MSELNQRENYPNRQGQGRPQYQEDYSNGIVLFCIICLLIIIVGYGMLEAYYPEILSPY